MWDIACRAVSAVRWSTAKSSAAQTVVSCEIAPTQTAVLTVGSRQAGTTSNIIPDHAVLQLNLRSYSQQTRQRMLDAIRRIVRAECQAAGSPQDPDFQTLDSYPLTDNDADTTRQVAAAFGAYFADRARQKRLDH